MYRNRTHYWTCSNIADWLRGTTKPHSATSKEWNTWHKTAKQFSKIRYWIAEDGLGYLQDIVYYPSDVWYNIRTYIRNRWMDQSHALVASKKHIPRGEWRDGGDRFLYCLFDSLVDFVEIEKAWMQYISHPEKYKLPLYKKIKIFKLSGWRNKEAGLDYLKWESTLVYGEGDGIDKNHKLYGKPTPQADAAKEILALYIWWTETYATRPDPYDASGWLTYCDEKRKREGTSLFSDHDNETPAMRKKVNKMLANLRKLEKQYATEDERMLIRLIKIRDNLWT